MICLADDEQATALRAARYALERAKAVIEQKGAGGAPVAEDMAAKLERLIKVLELKKDQNGLWRCLCVEWHQPDSLVCAKCGMARPT